MRAHRKTLAIAAIFCSIGAAACEEKPDILQIPDPTQRDGGPNNTPAGEDGGDGAIAAPFNPETTSLSPATVYLYGYLRDDESVGPLLGAYEEDQVAWAGLPPIVKSDKTILIGLRDTDGLPVYVDDNKVMLARPDSWSPSKGVSEEGGRNDEALVTECDSIGDGRLDPVVEDKFANRGIQLIPGSESVIVLCCRQFECEWKLDGDVVPLATSRSLLAASPDGHYLMSYLERYSVHGQDGSVVETSQGVSEDHTERWVPNGFWVVHREGPEFRRLRIGYDGSVKDEGAYPLLPLGVGVRSCALTGKGILVCIMFTASEDRLYSMEIGAPDPVMIRAEPYSQVGEIGPPYAKIGAWSVLVTGTATDAFQ